MDDDRADATADARWLSYDELAKIRGISRDGAISLTRRHRWERRIAGDGAARVAIPQSMLEANNRDHSDNMLADIGISSGQDGTIRPLEGQIAALQGQLESVEAHNKTLREHASNLRAERDRALERIVELQLRLAQQSGPPAPPNTENPDSIMVAISEELERGKPPQPCVKSAENVYNGDSQSDTADHAERLWQSVVEPGAPLQEAGGPTTLPNPPPPPSGHLAERPADPSPHDPPHEASLDPDHLPVAQRMIRIWNEAIEGTPIPAVSLELLTQTKRNELEELLTNTIDNKPFSGRLRLWRDFCCWIAANPYMRGERSRVNWNTNLEYALRLIVIEKWDEQRNSRQARIGKQAGSAAYSTREGVPGIKATNHRGQITGGAADDPTSQGRAERGSWSIPGDMIRIWNNAMRDTPIPTVCLELLNPDSRKELELLLAEAFQKEPFRGSRRRWQEFCRWIAADPCMRGEHARIIKWRADLRFALKPDVIEWVWDEVTLLNAATRAGHQDQGLPSDHRQTGNSQQASSPGRDRYQW